MATDELARFHEILEEFDDAMLVTSAKDGTLHARPMRIARRDDAGELWFLSAYASAKVDEIVAKPLAAVTCQGAHAQLAMSGTARVIDDRKTIADLWQKGFELWFPNGPSDPDVVAISFEPDEAEYWNQLGAKRVQLAVRAIRALLHGKRITHDSEEHARVKL